MSLKVNIRGLDNGKFFVEVPAGKAPATVMADTVVFLRLIGEQPFEYFLQGEGFIIALIMREGTFSALQGAVTNALEGLTVTAR